MVRRTAEREQFLADIITGAIEGGINYWAATEEYKWDCPAQDTHAVIREVLDFDAPEYGPPVIMTLDTIARGIRILLEPGVEISPDIREAVREGNRDNDACYIDADAADCIVQMAIFGKLVFG